MTSAPDCTCEPLAAYHSTTHDRIALHMRGCPEYIVELESALDRLRAESEKQWRLDAATIQDLQNQLRVRNEQVKKLVGALTSERDLSGIACCCYPGYTCVSCTGTAILARVRSSL